MKQAHLAELLPGARVAVGQCLNVQPDDRMLVITDADTKIIGEALATVARETGAVVEVVQLEMFGERPFTEVPEGLRAALEAFRPTVTFFAAQGQPGEVSFRIQLGHILRNEFTTRHGHMIGITPALMKTGMRADYQRVAALTMRVYEHVRNARQIRVTNEDGTDFTVYLDPEERRWVPCTGLYHEQGQWGNLPEGEVFTAPVSAEGTLTANLLGDYFSHKYGLLEQPMHFYVKEGEIVRLEHPQAALVDEVWAYLSSAENGRRVGEFAIGTNEALTALTGNLLQDEKFPGVHVAFGNPYPDLTGADWTSAIHVDIIPLNVNVWVDGERLMERGQFVIDR